MTDLGAACRAVRAAWRRQLGRRDAGDLPLLDAEELDRLQALAHGLPHSLVDFPRSSDHPLSGDRLATRRGRGYEFADNRQYLPGDEPRLLNWRLYARSGVLHTRIYTEERRPQVCLVVDRRPTMGFATAGQLKATLAARLALLHLYQALQRAWPVSVALLDQRLQWYAPAFSRAQAQPALQAMIAPCPPRAFGDTQVALPEALALVDQRLPAGGSVLLISDFADLQATRDQAVFYRLAARQRVRALQILDPVEERLPDDLNLLFAVADRQPPLAFSAADRQGRDQYQQLFAAQQAQLHTCLRACGIDLHTCNTTQTLQDCLGSLPSG